MSWASIAKTQQPKETKQLFIQYNILPKPAAKPDDGIPRHKEVTPGPADDMFLSNGEHQENIVNEYNYEESSKSQSVIDYSINTAQTPDVSDQLIIEETIKLISEHKAMDEIKVPDSSHYALNLEHVHFKVHELSENIAVNDTHSGKRLLEIFDAIQITADHLALWQLWSGSFKDKSDARQKLETVITYAETNPSSPRIQKQLRVITKLILEKGTEKSEEYVHILLLLASHGNVCNVMKDIGINNGYGMMTDNCFGIIKLQTLEQQILKELRNYRHVLVEEMHLKFKFDTNQHTINGFYNAMADIVGLVKYVDVHLGQPSWGKYKKGLKERFFATVYTKEKILQRVYRLIDERKISYQKIVQFYQNNCPASADKMDFLCAAIDIDDGKVNEKYLCWILEKLKVFVIKGEDWKAIEKCWED